MTAPFTQRGLFLRKQNRISFVFTLKELKNKKKATSFGGFFSELPYGREFLLRPVN